MATKNERRPVKQPVAAQPLTAGETAGAIEGVEAVPAQKPLRPSQCRTYLRKTVAAAYRDIVAGFVGEAKTGSCQHMKMATEVVEPEKREKRKPRGKGPAALMLEQLERDFPG